MRHLLGISGLMVLGLFVLPAGCRDSDKPTGQSAGSTDEARKPPEFNKTPAGENVDMNKLMAEAMQRGQGDLPPGHPPITATAPAGSGTDSLPPGHPPIGNQAAGPLPPGATLPAGHPPIGQPAAPVAFSGDLVEPEQTLAMNPPASWNKKQTRPMTVAVYALPQPEGARAEAELTISHYPGMKNVPLQAQVDRWAGQFKLPAGQTGDLVKQSKLPDAAHPTTLVDIAGTYQASSMAMGGGAAAPKDDYRMMVAVLDTEQGPWFFRLVGPKETIAAHEADFLKFTREAK